MAGRRVGAGGGPLGERGDARRLRRAARAYVDEYPGASSGQGGTPECLADIERILAIWADCRARFGGEDDFLFGRFGIADAMFAPVVLRFQPYGVALEGAARDYADAVLALPVLQAWVADVVTEPERIEKFDL